MRKMIKIAGLSFLLNTALVFFATAQNTVLRHIGPNDIYRMSTISSPKISPEGNWVLYSAPSIDSAKDKFSSKLYMVSADGKETVTLTEQTKGTSNYNWSPDGKYISFLKTNRFSL